MNLQERKSFLIQQCFIAMADNDYLTARWTYSNGLFHNFGWPAAQCVEKYLKALLLYNSRSTKTYGHNLNVLFEEARSLFPSEIDIQIVLPESMAMGQQNWQGKPIGTFVDYLNQYGSSNSRYGLSGTFVNGPVIHPLDTLCFALRACIRHNNFFGCDIFQLSERGTSSWDKITNEQPWMISGDLLLEGLFVERYQAGQNKSLRAVFQNRNHAFFQDREENESTFGGMHISASPFHNHLVRLEKIATKLDPSIGAKENLSIITELRAWACQNIKLPNDLNERFCEPRKLKKQRS